MHLIALTGGIASGKSTVARRWQSHGAVVVDADVLAREVVQPGSPVLGQIEQRFGPQVISADGSLDRSALGSLVFASNDAREALNGITHPAIGRLAQQRFDEAASVDADVIVVYDVPLLVETAKSLDPFVLVVTVEAAPEVRVQRLIEDRGMPKSEAEGRVAAQATTAERQAVADFVIDSNDSLDETERRADEVWSHIVERVRPPL